VLTCGVPELWHHHSPVGAVVVDVGARQAGVGQARHVALGDVLRLWQQTQHYTHRAKGEERVEMMGHRHGVVNHSVEGPWHDAVQVIVTSVVIPWELARLCSVTAGCCTKHNNARHWS
jgi:hypothetical protein